uniref:Uncharacterized protein n=2 Tax=gambiae species complex TaxID=44542 RepID=A0A2C9H3Q7_ANOGA
MGLNVLEIPVFLKTTLNVHPSYSNDVRSASWYGISVR